MYKTLFVMFSLVVLTMSTNLEIDSATCLVTEGVMDKLESSCWELYENTVEFLTGSPEKSVQDFHASAKVCAKGFETLGLASKWTECKHF